MVPSTLMAILNLSICLNSKCLLMTIFHITRPCDYEKYNKWHARKHKSKFHLIDLSIPKCLYANRHNSLLYELELELENYFWCTKKSKQKCKKKNSSNILRMKIAPYISPSYYILMLIKRKEGKYTCCLIVENSGWLAAITALNIRGGIPCCF